MPLKFGLALDFWNEARPLDKLLDDYAALLGSAESYGFDSVWAGENRPREPGPGHVPSPLLILAALSRSTRLRLGTGVLLLPIWHPLALAYDAAVLDNLCSGRLVLGVGVGVPQLMERYGLPPEEAGSRMEETLRALKKLWAGEQRFRGKHFSIEGGVYPAPVQPGGPPLWVGGKLARSVERAAALGDGWYAATPYHFALIQKQSQRYRERLDALGRDRARATVAVNRIVFVAETDAQARKEGKAYISQVLEFYRRIGQLWDAQGNLVGDQEDLYEMLGDALYFAGSPETCARSIRKYRDEAGVNYINLRISMGGMPLELAARTVTLLGERVLPQFR